MKKIISILMLLVAATGYSFAGSITGTITDYESKLTLIGETNTGASNASNAHCAISNILKDEHVTKATRTNYQIITKEIVVTDEEPVLNFNLIRVTLTRDISGKVTNEKGDGIPGVDITIEGTMLGTTTNIKGNYAISVPDTAKVLVFSHVGYNAFTVDMAYVWNFAPGSELRIVWENAIYTDEEDEIINSVLYKVEKNFRKNLNNTLNSPATNSFSIKLLYYLDYYNFRQKFKK